MNQRNKLAHKQNRRLHARRARTRRRRLEDGARPRRAGGGGGRPGRIICYCIMLCHAILYCIVLYCIVLYIMLYIRISLSNIYIYIYIYIEIEVPDVAKLVRPPSRPRLSFCRGVDFGIDWRYILHM